MRLRLRAAASDSARARTGSEPRRAWIRPCDRAGAPRTAGKSPEPAGELRIRWTVSPSSDGDFHAPLGRRTRARRSIRLRSPTIALQRRPQELTRGRGGIGRELLGPALGAHTTSPLPPPPPPAPKPAGRLADAPAARCPHTPV